MKDIGVCVCECVSRCFAFIPLLSVSWLELGTETGLRVKTGSEILHTPTYCTSHCAPAAREGRVGEGGGGGRVGTRSTEWVLHIKLLARPEEFRGGML